MPDNDANNGPTETVADLLRRYAAGEREFVGVDLGEQDLSGVTLVGARFDESWFHSANFERADLRGVTFHRCNVKCINFCSADLRGASFDGSCVEAGEYDDAQLDGVSFVGATYHGLSLTEEDGFPTADWARGNQHPQ